MKRGFIIIIACVFLSTSLYAQQFIDKAEIEYEVKTNLKKTTGVGLFEELIQGQLPEFKTAYYTLSLADDKSIYKFDRWGAGATAILKSQYQSDESNEWYYDFDNNSCHIDKFIWGSKISIADSIPALDWKLDPSEFREIAGFNCRKAQAIIFDSVYVFAFYTEEITLPGGPASFNGLPGTILGVSVPRLHTSWLATKVSVTGVKENVIKAPKQKKAVTYAAFRAAVIEQSKIYYTEQDPEKAKLLKAQMERFVWESIL